MTVRPGGSIGAVSTQGPSVPPGAEYDAPTTIEIGEGGTINHGAPITNGGVLQAGNGPAHVNSGGGGNGGGGGHGGGGGGWGTNGGGGGWGTNGGGGGWGTNSGSGGVTYGGPITTSGISCTSTNNNFINYGWSTNTCNTYYSYGYYDYYNYFGGSINNCFNYSGLFNGVQFSLVYPFLSPGCQVLTIVPRQNRRVVILESDCGTFCWRVVERRTWVPGGYVWIDGCDRWVDGYWTWRVVRKSRIYDYWDCMECYY